MVFIVTPLTVLITILIITLCLAFWVLAFISLRKGGKSRVFGLVAFQLALVLFFFSLLHNSLFGGLFAAAFTPLTVPFAIHLYWPFLKFIAAMAIWIAPLVAAVLVLCLRIPALRDWSLAVPLLAGLSVSIPVGEWLSKKSMCAAASQLGFDAFQRNSFSWSLLNDGQEFQWEIHAYAKVDDQRLGWSYSEMDWYRIPDDTWGEVDGPVFRCP